MRVAELSLHHHRIWDKNRPGEWAPVCGFGSSQSERAARHFGLYIMYICIGNRFELRMERVSARRTSCQITVFWKKGILSCTGERNMCVAQSWNINKLKRTAKHGTVIFLLKLSNWNRVIDFVQIADSFGDVNIAWNWICMPCAGSCMNSVRIHMKFQKCAIVKILQARIMCAFVSWNF